MKSRCFAYIVVGLALVAEYLRLLYDVPSNDEPYYVASALLTSIGGKPFFNELSFQQTAFMLYEPLVALYYRVFGTFGVYFFARQMYFVMMVAFAFVLYRYARRRTDEFSALIIPMITIAGIGIMVGTLSYNTLGPVGLGAFALFSILALKEQSTRFAIGAGLCAFVAMASYPTTVLVIAWHAILLGAVSLYFRRPFARRLFIGGAAAAIPLLLYSASLILRFGWENLHNCYIYTAGISAMGSFWGKMSYSWMLFSGYSPWLWLSATALGVWLILWRLWGVSYIYLLVLSGLFIASEIKPRPEAGDWLQTWILYSALLGLPVVIRSAVEDFGANWGEVVLYATGLVGATVMCWTSGMTLYSTNYAATLSLMAILILSYRTVTSRAAKAFLVVTLLIFSYGRYHGLFTSDHDVFTRNQLITWGPLAGFLTYQSEYDYYRQMQDDVDRVSTRARSILFYDEFASGYLMSGLYPATRALCSHMINQSYRVRGFFRAYYENPANRPDVIFRFRKHPTANAPFYWNVDPAQFAPAQDVFWHYLPEETGEYDLMVDRDYYAVYLRKTVPR